MIQPWVMNLPTLRPRSLRSEVNPASPVSHLNSSLYVTGCRKLRGPFANPCSLVQVELCNPAMLRNIAKTNKTREKRSLSASSEVSMCLWRMFHLKKHPHYFLNTTRIHIRALNRPPPCHGFMTGEQLTGRWGVINSTAGDAYWPAEPRWRPYCVRDYRHPSRIWSALPPPHRHPSHLLWVAQHATHFHTLHVLHHMGFSHMQTHLYTQTAC